jgi:hypothetical protein
MFIGRMVPSDTARQPGADLSAAGDAELRQDIFDAKGGSHGRTRVGVARLKS